MPLMPLIDIFRISDAIAMLQRYAIISAIH
jgi:hypothetical protein